MKIAVWGLGYVGSVSAACFAKLGHEVIGIDVSQAKVSALNSGTCAIVEPDLSEMVSEVVTIKRLYATSDGVPHVATTDISLICVGTPSNADGSANLDYLKRVSHDIGVGLRANNNYHVVVVRSTVNPSVITEIVIPALEAASGKHVGEDFGMATNPEFLRETSAIKDFFVPPYTVIGQLNKRSGDLVEQLYQGLEAPVYRVTFDESAILKLANNAFHALKIGFANEIGRLCDALDVDSHSVMHMVCADSKLNISTAYLKPGFAFGGSCLPKDLRSLTTNARRLNVELPILEAVLPSNRLQVEAARIKIHAQGAKQVGVLGLSFKPGTDDLRESPIIDLIRDLWRDGINVTVYDPDVKLERMLGSNFAYLERQLPQIRQIMCDDAKDVISHADIVLVSQKRESFIDVLHSAPANCMIFDLVRLDETRKPPEFERYHGLSW